MAKIREKDKTAVLNALAGGVTPRQGIQHIQVGRKEEVAAIIRDLEHVEQGGGAFRAIVASFGSGKALLNDTPILTEDGFRPMGEIEVRDKVYTRNGILTEVTHVFPQGNCDVYEVVLEDGRSVKCNENHLWFVKKNGFEQILTTSAIMEVGYANVSIPCLPAGQDPNGSINFENTSVRIASISELGYKAPMTCITVADDSASYICGDYVVTHNTFFLTLAKSIAEKRNFVTITTDFAPDRRLYSTSGFALNLYRAEIRSLSTPLHPEGGALEELLDAIDEKVISGGNDDFLNEIRRLPYGFDAITVCNKWHQAKNPMTPKEERDAFILKDACLRWFSAEATQENKKMLQVRSLISDDGGWDMLKTIAMLAKFAGYAGLLVELDEAVNLFRISNSQSREKNLEALLRILNECLQGDAKYIDVILASAPEILDPRRGAFSYAALRTRLASSEYAGNAGGVDVSGPMINLLPLSIEDQLVLLANITNVFALGDPSNYLATEEQMRTFLEMQYTTLGSEENKTPRDITRAWVMLLRMLEEDPSLTFEDVVGKVEVKEEKKASGLGAALDNARPNNSALDNLIDDEDDYGF